MKISQQVIKQLESFFPEPLQERIEISDQERKVEDFVNRFLSEGCKWWERAEKTLTYAKKIYKAAWVPYGMLRQPYSFRKLLHGSSPEKNLEILANVTAENVHNSVVTPGVCRQVPRVSLSTETTSAIAHFISGTSLLFPFVYSPAYHTFACIRNGAGLATMDSGQFFLDIGTCLNRGSQVYQGPEAIVGVATSIAMGALFWVGSYVPMRLLLDDSERKDRYQTLDRLYTEVAMLLKNRWDASVENDNKDVKKQCIELATKLLANMDLISSALKREATLTVDQVKDIILKLSWGANYVLNQNKLMSEKCFEPQSSST